MGVFDQKSTLQDILQHRGMFEPATDLPVINKAALVGYICHITTELAAKDLTIEALKSTFKETVIELSSTHGTAIDAINNTASAAQEEIKQMNVTNAEVDKVLHSQIAGLQASIETMKKGTANPGPVPPTPKYIDPKYVPVEPYTSLIDDCIDGDNLTSVNNFIDKEQYEKMENGSRETSYYGKFGYRYGRTHHPARDIPPELKIVEKVIEDKCPGAEVTSFLLSRYEDGNAYCPSHSDDEPSLSPTGDIYTFSFGTPRVMRFRNIHTGEVREITLHHNSLLVFSRASQCHWKHEIPADSSVNGVRISITVRDIQPFHVNSTYVYGDSNTSFIKFGTGPKTLGRWCPGKQTRTPRVIDLPKPTDVPPVRNMIIHTGLNDLRDRYAPLNPSQIVQVMESKCSAIHKLHPKMRIFLSPLLPTRDEQLNKVIRQTNGYIYLLSRKHENLFMTDNTDFANNGGFLLDSLASRKANDTVHLNLSGIIKLGMLFKSYVTSRYGYVDTSVKHDMRRIESRTGDRMHASVNSMNNERVQSGKGRAGNVSMMTTAIPTSNTLLAPPEQIQS